MTFSKYFIKATIFQILYLVAEVLLVARMSHMVRLKLSTSALAVTSVLRQFMRLFSSSIRNLVYLRIIFPTLLLTQISVFLNFAFKSEHM